MTVRLYTRRGCHLCELVAADLAALAESYPHTLESIDIDRDDALRRRYGLLVPVVVVAGEYTLVSRIDRAMLAGVLARAQSRDRPTG